MIPLVDLKKQYLSIKDEVHAEMEKVYENTSFICGPAVADFEQAFAEFIGVKHGIGIGSGFDSLRLALMVLNIGPGDEVITVANTFAATAFAISATGANVVLVDMDPVNYNIDVNQIEAAITPKTKAIMPVHLYGQPADMDRINEIAKKHNLFVIEDACQAHGAIYKGKRVGSLGDLGGFSFFPGKNMGAFGDGGFISTDNAEYDKTLKMIRLYGQSQKYHHDVLGQNTKLDSLQAAVLKIKLKYIDEWNTQRGKWAAIYDKMLADCSELTLPKKESYTDKHVYHLYVVQVDNRDEVLEAMKKREIFCGIHYPIPIHMLDAYKGLWNKGDFPVTEKAAPRILSLPIYPELGEEGAAEVVKNLKEVLAEI